MHLSPRLWFVRWFKPVLKLFFVLFFKQRCSGSMISYKPIYLSLSPHRVWGFLWFSSVEQDELDSSLDHCLTAAPQWRGRRTFHIVSKKKKKSWWGFETVLWCWVELVVWGSVTVPSWSACGVVWGSSSLGSGWPACRLVIDSVISFTFTPLSKSNVLSSWTESGRHFQKVAGFWYRVLKCWFYSSVLATV